MAVRVGILKARTFNDLGVAGIVSGVLISRGAGYAFGVGVVLCVLVYGRDFLRNWNNYDKVKDPVFNSRIGSEE
ncbi:MAG: rane protein [Firmicutes bacterium]|nr:rane protein [Bacillota bacterium]